MQRQRYNKPYPTRPRTYGQIKAKHEPLKSIQVHSWMDRPYGMLKNNYPSSITFNDVDKVWSSVDNYVYCNLIPNSTILRQTVEHEHPSKVLSTYTTIRAQLDRDVLSSSINHALGEKLKEDPNFRDILLRTTGTIFYLSKNHFLGYRSDDKGKGSNKDVYQIAGTHEKNFSNVYGHWLQQHRMNLQRLLGRRGKVENVDNDNFIYDYYLAEKGLRYALNFENLNRYLNQPTFQMVVTLLVQNYGREKIFIVDKDTALTIQRNRHAELYNNPDNLIRFIRKANIRKVKNTNVDKFMEHVFRQFVDNVMVRRYTLEDVSDIDRRNNIYFKQLSTISLSKKFDLIRRVYGLYEARVLPQEVMDQINPDTYYIPSINELNEFENDTVPIPVLVREQESIPDPQFTDIGGFTFVYPNQEDPPFRFGGTLINHDRGHDMLSPANDSTILTIEGLKFPSISHYLIVKLTQTIPSFEHIGKAYSAIVNDQDNLFLPLRDAEAKFNHIKHNHIFERKMHLLMDALTIKFNLPQFRDVLISTTTLDIEFMDQNELNYFTIRKLKELRQTLYPDAHNITITSLNKYMSSLNFLNVWLHDKVKDICFIIKCVQLVCRHYGQHYNLTSNFVKEVMDTFYGSCYGKVHINVPQHPYGFETTIQSFFKIGTKATSTAMTVSTINVLYGYFLVLLEKFSNLLYDISKEKVRYSLFTTNVIQSIWILNNHKPKTNIRFKVANSRNNGVLSALINLIIKIHNIAKGAVVTRMDVKMAASILLGHVQDIQPEVKREPNKIGPLEMLALETVEEEEEPQPEDEDVMVQDNPEAEEEVVGADEDEEEANEYAETDEEEEPEDEFINAYYEGEPTTIAEHFKLNGLTIDDKTEQLIKTFAATIDKKYHGMVRLRVNFYG